MKKAILVLAIGLLSAVYALFSWDAELGAGPRAWLVEQPSRIAYADNGYYALLGLFASPMVDPAADGHAQVRRYNAGMARETGDSLTPFGAGNDRVAAPDVVVGTNTLCVVEAEHCLGYLQRNADTVRALSRANEIFTKRYQDLYAYPHFLTAAAPGIGEPRLPLGDLRELHRLIVMQIGLEFLTRSRMRALEALKADIVFQRRLLADADSYELKMAALDLLRRDAHLYAQLIDSPAYMHRHLPTFDVQLRDLSDVERSLARATKREFRRVSSILMAASKSKTIAHASAVPASVVRVLYKPNATVNKSYGYFSRVMDLTALDSAELAREWPFESRDPGNAWGYVYNPVGSFLSEIVAPRLEQKILALHDADGLLRMVRIKRRILANSISARAVPEFLEAETQALTAPYDGRVFSWDPRDGFLYYDGPPGGDPSVRFLRVPIDSNQQAS